MINLFKSELRKKLLIYYFNNTHAEHYLRELAGILDVDPTNLSRELSMLEKQGIFISEKKGNQKYFSLNKLSPIFKELKSIIQKTIGVEYLLKDAFGKMSGIKLAILYGSFASGREDKMSDIDILIVGDINLEKISEAVNEMEIRLKREINVKIYSSAEFSKNKKTDPFLNSVFKNKYRILVGKL